MFLVSFFSGGENPTDSMFHPFDDGTPEKKPTHKEEERERAEFQIGGGYTC